MAILYKVQAHGRIWFQKMTRQSDRIQHVIQGSSKLQTEGFAVCDDYPQIDFRSQTS